MTQKTKNVAIEKFLEETTLKPCDFWAGKALEAWKRDCLNITLAQKGYSAIFQISVSLVTQLVDKYLSYLPVKQIWRTFKVCNMGLNIFYLKCVVLS